MSDFNENTRVQVPAALHLCKLDYSLSAGQNFDIKIDYVDITEEEFNHRMADFQQTLTEQFEENHRLEKEILAQLQNLKFNENVEKDNE